MTAAAAVAPRGIARFRPRMRRREAVLLVLVYAVLAVGGLSLGLIRTGEASVEGWRLLVVYGLALAAVHLAQVLAGRRTDQVLLPTVGMLGGLGLLRLILGDRAGHQNRQVLQRDGRAEGRERRRADLGVRIIGQLQQQCGHGLDMPPSDQIDQDQAALARCRLQPRNHQVVDFLGGQIGQDLRSRFRDIGVIVQCGIQQHRSARTVAHLLQAANRGDADFADRRLSGLEQGLSGLGVGAIGQCQQ